MPLSREEISQIAREAASQVTGMRCACKNLNEIFLRAIEKDLPHWGAPGSPEIQELEANLAALAKDCGFERNTEGHWIQWPKQEAVLNRLGAYEIRKEHDDGDLTLDLPGSRSAVLTTDGELFVTTPESIRIAEGY